MSEVGVTVRSMTAAEDQGGSPGDAQFGPHRFSAGEGGGGERFRGARFDVEDLRGARFSEGTSQVMFDAVHRDCAPAAPAAFRFSNEDVVSIDGMPADRLASIYHLSATGQDVAAGKRRGRKPRAAA